MRTIPIRAARTAHDERSIALPEDRKSTRLNSSHSQISYAVFCLKKKHKYTCTAPIKTMIVGHASTLYVSVCGARFHLQRYCGGVTFRVEMAAVAAYNGHLPLVLR